MALDPPDDALLVAITPAVNTVPDVIARMQAVDAALPPEDGLKWFNMLYLMVTEQIGKDLVGHLWADNPWLEQLDVIFARLFFEAIRLSLQDPANCPRAWVPLFEARRRPGVARVQFGIAGMNAHINRDLPLAVVRTCEAQGGQAPQRDSPQHADYERVNDILAAVEITAMEKMATGVIGEIARALSPLDDRIAMWDVRKARDAAWTNAEVLWALRASPELAGNFLATLDRMAGFAGRGVLVRTELPGASAGA